MFPLLMDMSAFRSCWFLVKRTSMRETKCMASNIRDLNYMTKFMFMCCIWKASLNACFAANALRYTFPPRKDMSKAAKFYFQRKPTRLPKTGAIHRRSLSLLRLYWRLTRVPVGTATPPSKMPSNRVKATSSHCCAALARPSERLCCTAALHW